jgi:outer membrane protein assembly factor BamB
VFSQRALYAVAPRTGSVAWSYPWITEVDVNAADPLVVEDSLFISSDYGNGCAMLRVSPDNAELLWKNGSVASHFSSFLYLDGSIFANDGDANARRGAFVCLDAATGEERWRENSGVGSLLAVGGRLFLLGERGRLGLAEAASSGYREIESRAFPSKDRYWAPPVFSRGRLYVRSMALLYCLDLGS